MNILITGGAGYLGSALVHYFIGEGHHVTVIDCGNRGTDSVAWMLNHPRTRLVIGDIVTCDIPLGFDAIVHLASMNLADCKKFSQMAEVTNVNATERIVEHALKNKMKFGFASSCSVYARNDSSNQCNEEMNVNPLSKYAKTKLQAEKIVIDAGFTVFRMGTLCGISPNTRTDIFPNELIIHAKDNEQYNVFDLDSYRPYLHIKDACRFWNVMVHNQMPGIFNILSENRLRHDLVNYAKQIHHPLKLHLNMVDKKEDRNYRASMEKFIKRYGNKAKHTVQEAMAEIYNYYW